MGDEKEYFDKIFGLVEKSMDLRSVHDRINKMELKFTVAFVILGIMVLIMGISNPIIKILFGIVVK